MVAEITKEFMAEVNGAADENYWWGTVWGAARRRYAGQPAGG